MDMEIEVVNDERKRKRNDGKYFVPIEKQESLPVAEKSRLEEIKAAYEDRKGWLANKIKDEDVEAAIEIYANNPSVDMQNLGEAFHCSPATIRSIFDSDKWRKKFELAKQVRGDAFAAEGWKTASEPYEMFKSGQGEYITSAMVKAAGLKSNYAMMMAKAFNSEYGEKKEGGASAPVIVAVKTDVKLNI